MKTEKFIYFDPETFQSSDEIDSGIPSDLIEVIIKSLKDIYLVTPIVFDRDKREVGIGVFVKDEEGTRHRFKVQISKIEKA